MSMKLHTKPTTELTLHPAAKHLPRLAEESGEFAALLAHIAEFGAPPEPLKVNQFRVVMGVDAWEACKQLGIKTVPCIEIEPEEIFAHLTAELTARAHFSKGQRAYLAYPLLAPLLNAARKRKIANLKHQKGGDSSQTLENIDSALSALSMKGGSAAPILAKFAMAKTAEDLAIAMGIGRRTFFQAKALHEKFAARPDLRERFEPAILEQDEDGATAGLGGILAGIAGKESTEGITPIKTPALELWSDRICKWFDPRKWSGWDKLTPDIREAAAAKYAEELEKATPPEVIARIEADILRRHNVRPKLSVVPREAQAS